MLPINKNNKTGPVTSSNLIRWEGPSIPCIDLCQGDSITDVTYKLALELCDILTQLDISTYDITCFNPVCPTPANFHDLIQFLIDQLCTCCTGSSSSSSSSALGSSGGAASGASGVNCPDCLINIAPCFYTTNEFGDTITQLQLTDYARAIGARVCTLANSIINIQLIQSQQQSQINNLIIGLGSIPPPVTLPVFLTTCLTDKIPVIPSGGIQLADLVNAIEEAFCELRSATGMPNDLLQAILKQCVGLDTSPSLNLPGTNMGSLTGWRNSGVYSTVADSINNMWITICDMRAAITSIQNTCCPQGCEGLIINLQVTFTAPDTINFFWTGDATGFEDCNPAGSLVTITDAYGNTYTTRIPITAYLNLPYALNIGSTPLNPATNLHINVEACWENLTTHSTCERCIEADIINQSNCPALTLSADETNIVYSFTNTITGPVTYNINLKLLGVTQQSQTIVTSTPGLNTGTFSGLFPGTTYTVEIQILINDVLTNTCPVGVITTVGIECAPPEQVSAETSPINPPIT